MRSLQILVAVIAVCVLGETGLPQAKRPLRKIEQTTGRYRAKRVPWKGPTIIKAVNMKLLASTYGDVSNPDGRAVPDDVIQNFDFSLDGNTLVVTYFPATLIVWNAQTGARKKVIELEKAGFGDVAYSPDGKMFVTAPGNLAQEEEQRSIRFWDAKTYKVIAKLKSAGVAESVKFSPDGKSLAVVTEIESSDSSKTILELWDVQSKKLSAVQLAKDRSMGGSFLNVMSQIDFSPDSRLLATSTKQTIEVWDIKTGEVVKTLQVDQGDVTSVWFSPDGRFLVSADEKRLSPDKEPVSNLTIWSFPDGQKIKTLPGYDYAAFFPDGRLVVSGTADKDYSSIDVKTGTIISHFPYLGALRFSRNGKRAASYDFDELVVVRTWELLK